MHTETVMVYFDDLDAMGVVHNGKYVTLFERALAAYWTRAGWPYDPGQPRFAEVLFAVREFAVTYHTPIARVGTVRVRFWLDRLGTTSLVYGFQVLSRRRVGCACRGPPRAGPAGSGHATARGDRPRHARGLPPAAGAGRSGRTCGRVKRG